MALLQPQRLEPLAEQPGDVGSELHQQEGNAAVRLEFRRRIWNLHCSRLSSEQYICAPESLRVETIEDGISFLAPEVAAMIDSGSTEVRSRTGPPHLEI